MAIKKTVINEVASALGATAARMEKLKPKRAAAPKHTKAQPAATETSKTPLTLTEQEEIELVAFLYAESRGFQGGSPDEDWLRAEQEVRERRGTKA